MVFRCCKCGKVHCAHENVSYFAYPLENPILLAVWEKYTGEGFQANSSSRLCHLEFDSSQYIEQETKNGKIWRRPTENAIPKGVTFTVYQFTDEKGCEQAVVVVSSSVQEVAVEEIVDDESSVESIGGQCQGAAVQGQGSQSANVSQSDHIKALSGTQGDSSSTDSAPESETLVDDVDEPMGQDIDGPALPECTDESHTRPDSPDFQANVSEEQQLADKNASAPEITKEAYWASLDLQGKSSEQIAQKLFEHLWALQQEHNKIMQGLKRFLEDDQLRRIKSVKRNNQPWSAHTVAKCYRVLAKVGGSSYEFLREDQGWPLVSHRTLQERASHIRFQPGFQHDIVEVLGKKVGNDELGRIVVMSFDEMSLRPAITIDSSSKSLIGFVSRDLLPIGYEDSGDLMPATHVQATMVRGLCWHFKQLVAYDFTGSSVEPEQLWNYHETMIKHLAQSNGVWTATLSFDFGPNNQALCHRLGVYANRKGIKVTVPHPADPTRKLVITTDSPHALKGLKRMVLKYEIILPAWYVEKYNLPTEKVNVTTHLARLLVIQNGSDVILAPTIRDETLRPKNWESMRVSDALAIFNRKVPAALRTCVENEWIEESALSTAKIIETITIWYEISSARKLSEALWKDDVTQKTDIKLAALQEFKVLIHDISLVNYNQSWHKTQTSVLICTEALLTMYKIYVSDGPLRFLLPARLTTECVENKFAVVRDATGDTHPTAGQTKTTLKAVTLSEALSPPRGTSYGHTSDINAVTLFELRKKTAHSFPDLQNLKMAPSKLDNTIEEFGIYHMAGWALAKALKLKDLQSCIACKEGLLIKEDDLENLECALPYQFTLYLTKGGLRFVSHIVFTLGNMAIKFFTTNEKEIIQNNKGAELQLVKQLTVAFLAQAPCMELSKKFPDCHAKLMMTNFCVSMFTSICKRKLRLLNKLIPKPVVHAGKTALMRTNPYVENKATSSGHQKRITKAPEKVQQRKKRRVMPSGKKSIVGIECPSCDELAAVLSLVYSIQIVWMKLIEIEIPLDTPSEEKRTVIALADLAQIINETNFETESAAKVLDAFNYEQGGTGSLTCAKIFDKFLDAFAQVSSNVFNIEVVTDSECCLCEERNLSNTAQLMLEVHVARSDRRLQESVNNYSVAQKSNITCTSCGSAGGVSEKKYLSKQPTVLIIYLLREAPDPLLLDNVLNVKLVSNRKKKFALKGVLCDADMTTYTVAKRNSRWFRFGNGTVESFSKDKLDKECSYSSKVCIYEEL